VCFCSCEPHLTGESSKVIVSQIAGPILVARCRAILHRFAEIEKEVGMSTELCMRNIHDSFAAGVVWQQSRRLDILLSMRIL